MFKDKLRKGIVLLLVFVIPILYISGYVPIAQAASVTPTYYFGNDKDLPSPPNGLESVKFDPPKSGEKSIGAKSVETTFSKDNKSVSFTSNFPVLYVFVKAGDGGYLYKYSNNGVYGDTNLYSPKNQGNQGNQADISHVTFYFKPGPIPTPTAEPTPTPTLEPTPTPTPEPTPTPTPEPTPTPTPDPTPTPTPEPTPTPTPTPTPEPTPTPTLEPTPTPTPTPEPTPTPTPDPTEEPLFEFHDEEIPGGPVDPELEIPDEEIPGGSTELPKTGELPPILFYGSGATLVAIGAYFRRKFKRKI